MLQIEKRTKFETAIALNMDEGQIMSSPKIPLSTDHVDRITQMAWEDRTTFDAIRIQFDLTPGEVIKLMRLNVEANSFKLWRKRTAGRKKITLRSDPFSSGGSAVPINAAEKIRLLNLARSILSPGMSLTANAATEFAFRSTGRRDE